MLVLRIIRACIYSALNNAAYFIHIVLGLLHNLPKWDKKTNFFVPQDIIHVSELHLMADGQNFRDIIDVLRTLKLSKRCESLRIRGQYGRTVLHILAANTKASAKSSLETVLTLTGRYLPELLQLKDDYGNSPEFSASTEAKKIISRKLKSFNLNKAPTVLIFYIKKQREFARQEMISIRDAFTSIGIKPKVFGNFSNRELQAQINSSCKEEDVSALIICIMAHGDKCVVYDRDNQSVDTQQILLPLSHSDLEQIPKVLILQHCRSPRHQQSQATATASTLAAASNVLEVTETTVLLGDMTASTLLPANMTENTLPPGDMTEKILQPANVTANILPPGDMTANTLPLSNLTENMLPLGDMTENTLPPGNVVENTLQPANMTENRLQPGSLDANPTNEQAKMFALTTQNCLVVHSTLHGRPAVRNRFIPILARNIRDSFPERHFDDTVLNARSDLAEKHPQLQQIIESLSTMTKHFFPGAFDAQ